MIAVVRPSGGARCSRPPDRRCRGAARREVGQRVLDAMDQTRAGVRARGGRLRPRAVGAGSCWSSGWSRRPARRRCRRLHPVAGPLAGPAIDRIDRGLVEIGWLPPTVDTASELAHADRSDRVVTTAVLAIVAVVEQLAAVGAGPCRRAAPARPVRRDGSRPERPRTTDCSTSSPRSAPSARRRPRTRCSPSSRAAVPASVRRQRPRLTAQDYRPSQSARIAVRCSSRRGAGPRTSQLAAENRYGARVTVRGTPSASGTSTIVRRWRTVGEWTASPPSRTTPQARLARSSAAIRSARSSKLATQLEPRAATGGDLRPEVGAGRRRVGDAEALVDALPDPPELAHHDHRSAGRVDDLGVAGAVRRRPGASLTPRSTAAAISPAAKSSVKSIASSIARSMCWPTPVASRWRSAASTAMHAVQTGHGVGDGEADVGRAAVVLRLPGDQRPPRRGSRRRTWRGPARDRPGRSRRSTASRGPGARPRGRPSRGRGGRAPRGGSSRARRRHGRPSAADELDTVRRRGGRS